MIKIKINEVMGICSAMHGMRNPLDSWEKNDTTFHVEVIFDNQEEFSTFENDTVKMRTVVGKNDKALARKLIDAGPSHRKFMRQIFVSIDIEAPLYWWKEFDTYKVGTTANSCSTMHTIINKEFAVDDFSHDKMVHFTGVQKVFEDVIQYLNSLRECYLKADLPERKKMYWYSIIQLLPSSYNQLRTVTMSYENLRNIYEQRKNHKLDEWRDFCNAIEFLPYSNWITDKEENENND